LALSAPDRPALRMRCTEFVVELRLFQRTHDTG
jgi:hypothetical protein